MMMKKGLIALGVALLLFGTGTYLGRSSKKDVMLTSSTAGASYSGGFKAAGDGAATHPEGVIRSVAGPAPKNVVVVKHGQSIQAAIKAAPAGTIVRVMPGTYHETVYIDKDDIRIVGVIEEGRRAVLDGEKKLNDAILYSGNNFVAENLEIRNYKGNGIMGQAGNNFEIRNNVIASSGVYGIFPQLGQNGIVEHNVVSGIADAAIYIGMSDNILVAHNEVFDSVAGIEIENSRHAIVEHNYVHDNSGGLLAFVTPGLPIKTTVDVIFRNNFVVSNNHANFGAPGSTVSGIPAGTGILVMAADDVVIEGNVISDNKVSGVIITDHAHASNITADPESDPNSDRVKLLDNVMLNNGYDTIKEAKALLLADGKVGRRNLDLVRVGPSPGSCIINRHQYVTAGVGDFAECEFTNTAATANYLLPPVPPRVIEPGERGKVVYLGICSGCHVYNGRMIGPPVQAIQALYMENPQGLADYIAHPQKKRDDYPEMPPQDYLDPQTRLAVANYMLKVTN
jgi:parallel beta-helix repeat protein